MVIGHSVLIIIIAIFLILKRKQKKIRSNQYIESLRILEGKNFFCYNNKTDIQEVIEKKVIPHLSSGIEIIFLNGKVPESDYDRSLISSIFYRFKNYSKFPHLFKVRKGEVIERSINNEFYNLVNQNKSLQEFIKRIHDFFEIKVPPDTLA